MASFKVCLVLTILVSANAKFHEERFESPAPQPWMGPDDRDFASSDQSPSHSRFSESKKKHPTFDSPERFEGPKEWLPLTLKKEPRENKGFKKTVTPFYTITDKDSQKYKDIVFKSGVPYCQETKTKRMDRDSNAKDSLVCYKCKNPKNGATYEQCSYISQPLSDSSNIEETVAKPSSLRSRRSSSEESSSGFRGMDDYRKHSSPYRFSERLFSEATDEVPSEYRNKNEKCEKIVKNSMVCMVCRDTKSNGKYEQCSYVRQPTEKSYAYTKSSSFKDSQPRKGREDDGEGKEATDRAYSKSKPVKEDSNEKEHESQGSKDSSSNCKKVERDSKTCTICKDPETGGNYERCSYTYQPNDKVYKFSRSKSFGSPKGSSAKEDSPSDKVESEAEEYKRDYSIPESFYERSQPSSRSTSYFKDEEPSSSYLHVASEESKTAPTEEESSGYEKSKSESQRIAESMEPSNCKEVQKNSMTCKVCKDPKTGSNSEQCSYKYQPSDKSYSFTKSRSFGSPNESGDKSYDGSEKTESREPAYKDESYDFTSEKGPYNTDSTIKREFREFAAPTERKDEAKEEPSTNSTPKKVDVDFYDAFKKKAEIQKFLQEFQKEDRSNCKKMMRDKMTCYQCVDEKGFRKEECAFVTSDEPGDKVSSSGRDTSKEEESREEPTKKILRSTSVEDRLDEAQVEPDASASENVSQRREKPTEEGSKGEGEHKEAEAYEYVAETRPVFDKVLGFTLPAYMLSTSEQEEEFDKAMAAGSV